MKSIKLFLLVTTLVGYIRSVHAQAGLTLEVSPLLTSFKFTDKAGVKHNSEYQGIFTGAYGVGYRMVSDIGLIINPAIGMRHGGANLVYDDINYSWRLQYANLKLGLGYMTPFEKVNPYFMVSGYYAFLLRGTQTLHNEILNITKSDVLSNIDYGLVFSSGINVKLSDYVSTYAEFNYLKGLTNIEKDPLQKSKNFAFGLTIGVAFAFSEN